MNALAYQAGRGYDLGQVLNTLSKAALRSVTRLFCAPIVSAAPLGERLSVRTAARLSTGVQLPHLRLEQRGKKSLERSNPLMSIPAQVTPAVSSVKICAKCGEEKPLSDFSKDRKNKDGMDRLCKCCHSEKNKAFREKNRETILAKKAAYRLANKAKLADKCKEYYARSKVVRENYLLRNKDRLRELQAAYREKNKDKVKERRITYEAANLEKKSVRERNRRARKRNAEGSHTAADIQQLLVLQKNKCASCRKPISSSYHVDHVMPLALGGGNGKDNLQLLCPHCNLSKHAQHPVEFMQSRGMLL